MNLNILAMKHASIILFLLLFLMPGKTNAQQEPIYGQYMFNVSVINPAQAGGNNANQWGVLSRHQWLGVDGAPETQTVFANFRLPRRLGMSIGIYHDRLGPEVSLQFQTDLAYHARITDNFNVSAGIRLVGSHLRVNLSEVPNTDPGNPLFQENLSSGLMFNAGAGILAYSNKTFFGVSVPKVFRTQMTVSDSDFRKKQATHLFAYAGLNLDLSDEFLFIPSTMFRYVDDAPVQLDLNTVFSYRNILDFGPMIRTNLTDENDWFDAVGFLIGIQFLEKWYFGYMYEYPLSDIRNLTKQTHEVTLRFSWDTTRERFIRSPRYFL
ncbi:MAG: type IX secretion system membrane protein PorP/SprF [Bacteroidia bacterium]|nr:MAG: type IX secretion system membrane protein PorP/SprF [Bacteroidia bacterium]